MKNAPKNLRTVRHPERGAAAVEFALVLPLFLILVFGAIDFGWYFHQRLGLTNAVNDGVRQGVTAALTDSPDPATKAKQIVQSRLPLIGLASSNVTLTTTYGGSGSSKTLTLTAVAQFKDLTGFISTPAALKGEATMMLEQQ